MIKERINTWKNQIENVKKDIQKRRDGNFIICFNRIYFLFFYFILML